MQEIRCEQCNKMLGKLDGKAEIKCPRCKFTNALEKGIDKIASNMLHNGFQTK